MKRPAPFTRIEHHIKRTRLRYRSQAIATGLGWGVATSGFGLLVAALAWGALEVPPWLRLPILGSLIAILFGTLAITGFMAWARARSEAFLANLWEKRFPELADSLLATVDFGQRWPHLDGASPELVEALAEQTGARLESKHLGDVLPWRAQRRTVLAVVMVAACWVIAGFSAGKSLTVGTGALLWGGTQAAVTHSGPLVGDLDVKLHYPPYTGRAMRTVPNSTGNLKVPKGTRVEMSAVTLGPAATVAMNIKGEESALQLRDKRDVWGEFTVGGPMEWRFAVSDLQGRKSIESDARKITIEVDEAPIVELLEPSEDMVLKSLVDVPVRFETKDDFGLSKATIVVALVTDPDHPEQVVQPGVTGRRYSGADYLDLSVIQAQPGDRLALTVEVYDNNDVDGPQRGTSETRFITVDSPLQKHLELSVRLKELVDTLITVLADRLVLVWTPTEKPKRVEFATLSAETQNASDSLASVVQDMEDDPLTPEEVRVVLRKRSQALSKSLEVEKRQFESLSASYEESKKSALAKIGKRNDDVIDGLEQGIIMVEAMVARLALEDMAALTEDLKAARARLRDLIASYRDQPSDALKARIMRDIGRLKERMRSLRERTAQLRQKLPEEFLNLDGLKKDEVGKGLEQTQNSLDELEKMLDEGRIDEALDALDEMESALDELSSSLDSDMQDLHSQSNPEMLKAISELMDQTRDLMRQQKNVQEQTDALAEAEEKARRQALSEGLDAQLKEAQESARELRQKVDDLAGEEMNRAAEADLQRLQDRADSILEALEEKRPMRALENAEQAMEPLEDLKRTNRFGKKGENFRRLVAEANQENRKVMGELSELLDGARERMEQAMNPSDSEAARQQQQALAEAAKRLGQEMQDRGQMVPGLDGAPLESLEKATEAMQGATKELQRNYPGRAKPEQSRAQSQLQEMMKGLKQAAKPQQANRPRSQPRGRSKEKVKIPGARDHEAPAAFRKDLLDAMKDKSSERYQEQVKRYYESLVR